MNDFIKLLTKPAKERRKLTDADVRTLVEVDLEKEWWTPGKTDRALELMQLALRSRCGGRECDV